jgi:hypothetical protein
MASRMEVWTGAELVNRERVEVSAVGVDWLTGTQHNGTPQQKRLGEFAQRLVQEQVAKGEQVRQGGLGHGYDGIQTEGVAFGVRSAKAGGDSMIRLSGSLARDYWREAMEHCRKVSRLDLQVTTKRAAPVPDLIREAVEAFKSWRETVSHRPPTGGIAERFPYGPTLYCGSRRSTVFGRLYDKGVEEATKAKEPAEMIAAAEGLRHRYELETKQEDAQKIGALLMVDYADRDAEGAKIAELVKMRFEGWGIVCPWEHLDGVTYERDARIPDMDRWLAWVGRAVAPGCERAIRSGRAGALLGYLFGEAAQDKVVRGELEESFQRFLVTLRAQDGHR